MITNLTDILLNLFLTQDDKLVPINSCPKLSCNIQNKAQVGIKLETNEKLKVATVKTGIEDSLMKKMKIKDANSTSKFL